MMKKRGKKTTEKTTGKIQALDDEELKGIVGGAGQDNNEEEEGDIQFSGESVGPDWSQDG